MRRKVLLYSGGLDSFMAWRLCDDIIQRVYVRIGAPYEARELAAIHELDRRWGHVHVVEAGGWLGRQADAAGRVPLRNLLFAVAAAAATGADDVVLTALAGETSPDKSRRFARLASAAMSASEGRRIRLLVPFRGTTKTALVRRYLRVYGRTSWPHLAARPSCYAAELRPGIAGCGRCMSCLRRWVAMSLNGVSEKYDTDPSAFDWTGGARGSWWKYLRRTPVRDWPGVARNNLELLRALRKAGR